MKAKVQDNPQAFKPVTIDVTFETQEEFDLFMRLLRYNVTVPKAIATDTDEQEKLAQMLNTIRVALESGQE